MPDTVMIVSYNSITGIPTGRYQMGNAIAYSAEWGFEKFGALTLVTATYGSPASHIAACKAQEGAAENTLSELEDMISRDLPMVETVYVYVGMSAIRGAMSFIKKLQQLKKKIHMIACSCDRANKVDFARTLGIDVIWTNCGGEHKCGEIFAKHSSETPV